MRLNDELNNITFDEEEYFREYFKPMDIPEEAKKEREEASEDIFDLLLFMFLLIDENLDNGAFSYNELLTEFQRRYADIIATYGRNDAYFQSYLEMVPGEILNTTIKNLDNEYYTSRERAARIAVNEANTILNYEDLQKAIDEGKNVKIWHTQRDSHVRDSHRELEGKKIGIKDFFKVGQSLLLFPCDEVNCTNIRDIAGCRCYAKADFDPKYEQSQQNRVEKSTENDKINVKNRSAYTPERFEDTYHSEKAVIPRRKIVEFLLLPDAKHYEDFIGVGYSKENPDLLAAHILDNFDYSKRIDEKTKREGIEFAILMSLGINEKKTFRTAWRMDNEYNGLPRFVSAYRYTPK